jgi:hypothetical protein
MLHARKKQIFVNNYMITQKPMYFSTSLDDNTDTNGTSELMLLITDRNNFYFMTEDMKGKATCVVRL